MQREYLYYAVIGVGVLIIAAVIAWTFWPEPEEPLPPPQQLTQTLDSSAPKEEKVQAARNFIRHGEAARTEIRGALTQHTRHEPEVVAPLVKATAKTRDYRSMPVLLELLEHPDPKIRGRAGAAVSQILGADMGFDANAPEAERARVIEMIRQDYEVSKQRFPEVYKDQTR